MPMIRIQYDDTKLINEDARALSEAARSVVSEATGIADVFAYADCARINIAVAPVEVFVEMSAGKIGDGDGLVRRIREGISFWKQETGFPHPINLTLIPMSWKVEIGI